MGRRVSAKDRYFETGKAMDRVIDEAAGRFAATAQGRHGHLPRNEAERREMSRLDWPLVGFWDAYDKAMADAKRVMNGAARHENRPEKPQNSNDEIIALLKAHRPADLRGRFTLSRAESTREWLRKRGKYKSTDAIIKMVNRYKQRG